MSTSWRMPLEVTSDRRHPRHHHLEHRMPDVVRIAAIRHRLRKAPAHADITLGPPQQQKTALARREAA
jgi:hypothetical protein